MTRRPWLPHPATTPPPRPDCPTRRYPNQPTAIDALRNQPYGSRLQPTPCPHGHTGWHLTPPEPEPEPAVCEPNWRDDPDELDRLCEIGARLLHGNTAIYDRDITTVPITGDLL